MYIGLFHLCLYLAFHGPYTEHCVDITPAQQDDDAQIRANHGAQVREEIRQTLNLHFPPFFFALIFQDQHTTRPTFILLGRHSVMHPVRIRCHILGPDIPSTYPNYSRCAIPTNICYAHPNQCQCEGLHSSLIDYESIMIVLTEYTPGGKLVSTMELDQIQSTETTHIYYLKETYLNQIEDYKSRRRQMHGDYVL